MRLAFLLICRSCVILLLWSYHVCPQNNIDPQHHASGEQRSISRNSVWYDIQAVGVGIEIHGVLAECFQLARDSLSRALFQEEIESPSYPARLRLVARFAAAAKQHAVAEGPAAPAESSQKCQGR